MYTAVLLVALSGSAPSFMDGPAWIMDYGEARNLSQKEEKPIAVFFGSGATGWNGISREGRMNQEIAGLLGKYYICLYLDTASPEGRRLARAFEMDESRGIVISNSKGNLQAFRHEGDLSNEDLWYYLQRFSNPNLAVFHTETNPPERATRFQESGNVAPANYETSVRTTRSC
jgi:hypothetical protein